VAGIHRLFYGRAALPAQSYYFVPAARVNNEGNYLPGEPVKGAKSKPGRNTTGFDFIPALPYV
jgi:hypothetical protein